MSKTITEYPPSGGYDCEKPRPFPFMNCAGATMRVGIVFFNPYDCGVVFKDLELPRNVEIVSATLCFRFASLTAILHAILSGWLAARDDLVWSPAENMSNVPITAAHCHWDAFFNLPVNGIWWKCFDVKPIVDELMAQANWRSHLDIAFVLRDNGSIMGFVPLMTFEMGAGWMPRLVLVVKPRVILTPMDSYEVPVY